MNGGGSGEIVLADLFIYGSVSDLSPGRPTYDGTKAGVCSVKTNHENFLKPRRCSYVTNIGTPPRVKKIVVVRTCSTSIQLRQSCVGRPSRHRAKVRAQTGN